MGRVYSTAEVANEIGVHRDTLLRWLRQRKVPEPPRNAKGWRTFTAQQLGEIRKFADNQKFGLGTNEGSTVDAAVTALEALDWDFVGAKTDYLTHSLHPYPAKFIPQIPNALIQELSSVGDTVLDVFCGSGTTLVEAQILKRNAIGIDANPLACLISRTKTRPLELDEIELLDELAARAEIAAASLAVTGEDLFGTGSFKSDHPRPNDIEFWFEQFVIEELAELKSWISQLPTIGAHELALVCFSSIIVAVSKQDSDTRYVRREKGLAPGVAFLRFAKSLRRAIAAVQEAADIFEPRFRTTVLCASSTIEPKIEPVDLLVTSPPYPNAYSYHLYHRTRMIWLGYDNQEFKLEEIGSHRKYSSKGKNGATVATFRSELQQLFAWLTKKLRSGGYACFVVGDSTIRGELVDNSNLMADEAAQFGFSEAGRIVRQLQATKKSFNPAIGKIRSEKILILRKDASL